MPYKDLQVRKEKSKVYAQQYRSRLKDKLSLLPKPERFCQLCSCNISSKRSDAKFCSKEHKKLFSDKKRDYASEYQKNKEHKRTLAIKYYYNNHDEAKKKQLERQKKFPEHYAASAAKYRAIKLLRTPKWLTEDDFWMIKEAYHLASLRTKMLGFQWHVDHIVPLQGDNVCGLHVPKNLQVIPAAQNITKHNKFEI
jgi:hypothetical protein